MHISNGRAIIAQRFAIDVVGLDENGLAAVGEIDGTPNEDWFGFGAELIAVAEGVVRAIRDGVPDRSPLAQLPPVIEVTLEAAAGNYVVLELGTNTFALYAHLQEGSVAVEVGQRVRRGDMLGRLGNSGNTSGPHLHFHISDAPGLDGEGLPFEIDSFGFSARRQPTTFSRSGRIRNPPNWRRKPTIDRDFQWMGTCSVSRSHVPGSVRQFRHPLAGRVVDGCT